jgi:ABC-type amino acid transport substrate-binding protein
MKAFALSALAMACATALTPPPATAGTVNDRVSASKAVKVCIWPDYYGVTYRNPRTQQLGGIDIDLSAQFAKDLGASVTLVDSSFPKLIEDLSTDKCDVAMFAIGVLPSRQAALKFSQPYLHSDIYGVTTRSNRNIKTWADIDQPGVQVAVQAGTFMEPVMAAALKQAKVVVVKPPMTREAELEAGRVDVFMTDYPYSRRLLDNADWARLVAPSAPFHVLPYAYAVKPGDEAWLKRVDEFVAQIKKDGRLKAAAGRNGLSDIVLAE